MNESIPMKRIDIFLPIAVMVAGTWCYFITQETGEVEEEIKQLSQQVLKLKATVSKESKQSTAVLKPTLEIGDKIDWSGFFSVTKTPKDVLVFNDLIRDKLKGMSSSQLLMEIESINASSLDRLQKERCTEMVLHALLEKDPKLVLEHYTEHLGDAGYAYASVLQRSFQKWLSLDFSTAMAWFEEQISAGKFEDSTLYGREESRLFFEEKVLRARLKQDPQLIAARLPKMSSDLRMLVLQSGILSSIVKPEDGAALALVLSNGVSDSEGRKVVSDLSAEYMRRSHTGYDPIDQLIQNYAPDAATERAILLEALQIGLWTAEQGEDGPTVEKGREWARKHVGDDADAVVGEAMGCSIDSDESYEKSSKVVLDYCQQGNQTFLLAYLKGILIKGYYREEAMPLLEEIKDPAKKAEMQKLYHK